MGKGAANQNVVPACARTGEGWNRRVLMFRAGRPFSRCARCGLGCRWQASSRPATTQWAIRTRYAFKRSHRFACVNVPDTDDAVRTAADKHGAARQKCQRLNRMGVSCERLDRLAGRRVPYPNRVVLAAAGEHGTVRRIDDRNDALKMSCKGSYRLPCVRVPNDDGAVAGAAGEKGAVRRKF